MTKFKELRERSRMKMSQFAEYFGIPYRTIQHWEAGTRNCPDYVLKLIEYKLDHAGDIYTVERNKDDFKKLFDYLTANEPADKQLKDAAGMRFYPSIIIEEFTK